MARSAIDRPVVVWGNAGALLTNHRPYIIYSCRQNEHRAHLPDILTAGWEAYERRH